MVDHLLSISRYVFSLPYLNTIPNMSNNRPHDFSLYIFIDLGFSVLLSFKYHNSTFLIFFVYQCKLIFITKYLAFSKNKKHI